MARLKQETIELKNLLDDLVKGNKSYDNHHLVDDLVEKYEVDKI